MQQYPNEQPMRHILHSNSVHFSLKHSSCRVNFSFYIICILSAVHANTILIPWKLTRFMFICCFDVDALACRSEFESKGDWMSSSGETRIRRLASQEPTREQTEILLTNFLTIEHQVKNLTKKSIHCGDAIMGTMASHITSLTVVYSTIYSGADQRKHQSYASLAFVRGIHRGPVNSPHKWPVTRKMFPFDDVTWSASNMSKHSAH